MIDYYILCNHDEWCSQHLILNKVKDMVNYQYIVSFPTGFLNVFHSFIINSYICGDIQPSLLVQMLYISTIVCK